MTVATSAEPTSELTAEWPLWGGRAQVTLRVDGLDGGAGPTALAAARRLVQAQTEAMDAAASRFRPHSEVTRLAAAGGRPLPASPLLREAVTVALRAADLTGGAVDPTLGQALIDAGYDTDLALLPPDRSRPLTRVRRLVAWRDVRVDEDAGTIQVPDGVLLDLGATAKALVADRAAAQVHAVLGVPVLVSLGGDLAVVGTGPEPWLVGVRERPSDPDQTVVRIGDCGVATSTTQARRWRMAGRPVHHLLDPTTGLPAREVWRTVTVCAGSCVDANAASTATVVMGREGAAWLTGTGLPARLVGVDSQVRTLGGWPADQAPDRGAA